MMRDAPLQWFTSRLPMSQSGCILPLVCMCKTGTGPRTGRAASSLSDLVVTEVGATLAETGELVLLVALAFLLVLFICEDGADDHELHQEDRNPQPGTKCLAWRHVLKRRELGGVDGIEEDRDGDEHEIHEHEVAVLRIEVEAGEHYEQRRPVEPVDDHEEVEAQLRHQKQVEGLLEREQLSLLELHPRLRDVVGVPQVEERRD
mmetsp:Transcript_53707/g.138865  ORF Transcript_53707/g.138865 Transcript_53707/m.138865 type:complete len:204 (+) Transcript_53707:436-1047(+)